MGRRESEGQNVHVCYSIFCVLSRSFHGGVVYNAILPSSGWTNVFAHSSKARINPANDKGKS